MLTAVAERTHAVKPDRVQGARLRVLPILGPSHAEPAYELLRPELLHRVKITEISESGSVPTVRVANDLEERVFLMDGQELIGAKQNRILNTDVLVPPNSILNIPVSCVERGRWHSSSASFSPGKAAAYRTRSAKLPRVHSSLKRKRMHDADQIQVWSEVGAALMSAGAEASRTMALSDAYAMREREMNEFRRTLHLPADAVGVAIFCGSQFQGLDIFDRHSTLEKFWASLVDSYAIDFLGIPNSEAASGAESEQVITLLEQVAQADWEPFDSPGEGRDWRLGGRDLNGSALIWADRVVLHLQLFPRQGKRALDMRMRADRTPRYWHSTHA